MRSSRTSFVVSALNPLAGGLLVMVLHGSLIGSAEASTRPKPGSNLIRVWTVGSPHTGALPKVAVPPELRRQAETLGYTIEVEAFQAAGFAAKFRQALQDHNEPEVLTFDNYGLLSGINTPAGWIEGVAADSQMALVLVHEALAALQPRGWVVLVRSAASYEAARALAMRAPVCQLESVPAADSATKQRALWQAAQEAAVLATRAYLACDQSTLSFISDDSRLGQKCFLPESDTQVEAVKACRVSGNPNLAFVSLVSTFSAQGVPLTNSGATTGMNLGQQSILAVLRKQGGAWRLLAITDDPVNTVTRIAFTTNTLERSLDDEGTAGVTPEAARPLTADGVYPRPAKGERFGDFIWQPSESPEVIGQVVEFLFGNDTRWGRTRLLFLTGREGRLSSGVLVSGGATVWRVWSVSKSGDVAFSAQHSFRH